KHHWLQAKGFLRYACDCGPLGRCGGVSDRADGLGMHVTPLVVHHAPDFYRLRGAGTGLGSETPIDATGDRWWNACEFASRGKLVPATRSLVSNDLGSLGYPGDRILGACFRGGYSGHCEGTRSVAEVLAWEAPYERDRGERRLIALLLNGD